MPGSDEITDTALDRERVDRALERGEQVGRYEIGERIGAGGMGVVYRARDPKLERDVAIKVIASQQGRSQERLLGEARAMAKLSHPAVVPVYDVGAIDDRVYVVMSYMRGGTLHEWIHGERRDWRAVVDRFEKVGRGLAAAHDAGLVHRDFKPRNVLIDGDDVLVADFGLALREPDTGNVVRGASTVGGTPGYMSPEQSRGDDVDARSDQFSFCVSLWEGLHGERPHDAETRTRETHSGGLPSIPPSRQGSPPWLLRAIARGFTADPTKRWPSVSALLAYIDRRRRLPRRVAVGAGAIVLVAGAASAAVLISRPAEPGCAAPADRMSAVWNPNARTAIETAFAASNVPYAIDLAGRIVPDIDARLQTWSSATIQTCKDRRQRRVPDATLDLRAQCLDRWLSELRGTVSLLAGVKDRASVDAAADAARALSPLSGCSDDKRLAALLPVPEEKRAASEQIVAELAEIDLAIRAKKTSDLAQHTLSLIERARALGHDPTLARALKQRAHLLRTTQDSVASKTVLEELTRVAARGGDDRTAAWAWAELVAVSYRLDEDATATQLLPAAHAALARTGSPVDLKAFLIINEAGLISRLGETVRALELLHESERELVAAGAENPGSDYNEVFMATLSGIGGAQGSAGDYEASIASFRRMIILAEATRGPNHPYLSSTYFNLAESLRRARKYDEALEKFRHARDITELSVGKSSQLVTVEKRIAGVLFELGRFDESLAAFDKTLALATTALEPGSPILYSVMSDRSAVLLDLGRLDDVIVQLEPVIAFYRARDPRSLASALLNRAGAFRRLGKQSEAIADYREAIVTIEGVKGGDRRLVKILLGLGRSYLLSEQPEQAIAPLERASADTTKGRDEQAQRISRWLLGRARVEARRDAVKGMNEVKAAREAMASAGDVEDLVELDAWLAKHNPK